MSSIGIPFQDTHKFSSLFLDYVNEATSISSFYNTHIRTLKEVEFSSFDLPQNNRATLVKVLQQQYEGINTTPLVLENIQSLQSKHTYTVTTGHQLNLALGPLYTIYKIMSVVSAADQLSKKNPTLHFVPVFWMATEDHDFDEINHFHLFGKDIVWETAQTGAVGRFSTEGIVEVLDSIKDIPDFIVKAYQDSPTLSIATRKIVNHLFSDKGVVVLDADDRKLKTLFVPTIKKELTSLDTEGLVKKVDDELEKLGYKPQVFARPINLFYLTENSRNRIVKEASGYKVLNTEQYFTKEELLKHVEESPECFSPNVVLRPVYQQLILPNVAYCGGPAEISYWMQLNEVFKGLQMTMPSLLPRFHAVVLTVQQEKKVQSFGLEIHDLFEDLTMLEKKFVDQQSDEDVSLIKEIQAVNLVYQQIQNKVEEIDSSMKNWVGAEEHKAIKSIENIEKKLQKSIKQRYEVQLNQLRKIYQRLFPHNGLQERYDNFLSYYINDPEFVSKLLTKVDAFDLEFKCVGIG